MTERLYLTDSMCFSCEATVLACEPCDDGFRIELDRSVFFPNKGGQPCDTGTIGDAKIASCDERGERLLHLADRALPIGAAVTVRIDGERRFDIMQQHTGEHLLSWCAWTLFGAVNVGFHCALDYATLDLDKPLTHEQLAEMERLANREAAKNGVVTATEYASEDEIGDLPLRKHAEGLTAPIRIVMIEGSDACTCCAPHVRRTGEIGQLKIVAALPYKGGVRLTFLCGGRALRHAQAMQDAVDTIARRFSTGRDNAVSAVEKQGAELSEAKKELKQAYAALDGYTANELKQRAETVRNAAVLVETVEHVDPKRLRALAEKAQSERSLVALFSVVDDTVHYVLSANGIALDMGELAKTVNLLLGGKGGGRGTLAQGSAPKRSDLCDAIGQLRHYCKQAIS